MKKLNVAALLLMTSVAMSAPALAGSNHDHEGPQSRRQWQKPSEAKPVDDGTASKGEERSQATASTPPSNTNEALKQASVPKDEPVRGPSAERKPRQIYQHTGRMNQ